MSAWRPGAHTPAFRARRDTKARRQHAVRLVAPQVGLHQRCRRPAPHRRRGHAGRPIDGAGEGQQFVREGSCSCRRTMGRTGRPKEVLRPSRGPGSVNLAVGELALQHRDRRRRIAHRGTSRPPHSPRHRRAAGTTRRCPHRGRCSARRCGSWRGSRRGPTADRSGPRPAAVPR